MQIKHLVCVILHIKRANDQTMVWNKALEACPSLPKPEDSGWYYSEGLLKPKLMTREEVLAACLQLAYCGCSREGGCCVNRRCTCVQLSLCCSKACKCGDRCRNDRNTAAEANEAWPITLIRWKSHGGLVSHKILCLWFISLYFWLKPCGQVEESSVFLHEKS